MVIRRAIPIGAEIALVVLLALGCAWLVGEALVSADLYGF